MRKITIVLDESVSAAPGAQYMPNMMISAENIKVNSGELAGILMEAYAQVAMRFVEQHPLNCQDCAPYQMHKANLYQTKKIYDEILVKYGYGHLK